MARNSQPVTNEYSFPVSLVNLVTPNGNRTSAFAVQREDTGEVFDKTFTNQYGLIRHDDVITLAEEAFDKEGLADFNRKISVAHNGARLYATYDFKSRLAEIPKVGDTVGFQMIIRNSYDGSLMAGVVAGARCLACSNGMTRLENEIELQKKHFVSLTLDMLALAIEKAANRFDEMINDYAGMAKIKLDNTEGRRILFGLEKTDVLSGKVRGDIESRWLNPKASDNTTSRSLWGLYNASTAEMRDLENNRFEYATGLNARLGTTFAKIAKEKDYLTKLIKTELEKSKN